MWPTIGFCLPDGTDVSTVGVVDISSTSTANYPVTFGMVFKQGDIPSGRYPGVRIGEVNYTTQANVKRVYGDGSVRFAVISVVVPVAANAETTLSIYVATSTNDSGQMSRAEMLSTDIESEIRLTNISGGGYSGSLMGDLNNEIDTSNYSYWLTGPICTEILSRDQLNNSLAASWEVRFYPTTTFGIRVSHSVENVESAYRSDISYDVDLQGGTPSLSSLYTNTTLTHYAMGRWRKVFWVGTEPPGIEIHYDIDYLISTGHILPYDTTITFDESNIASIYSSFAANSDINGYGHINPYLPATGGSDHRGMLPAWSVQYLFSWDYRMREIMLDYAHLYAEAPFHWRENDVGESNFGGPISIVDRPQVATLETYANDSGFDPLGAALGSTSSVWTLDLAHQPSFFYLPYIITGDKFYYDEMLYQAYWNSSMKHYDASWGRNYSNGLIRDQVRGEAWAFRNLVDAAALANDGSTEKTYLETIISNNVTAWNAEEDRYPLNWWGIDTGGSIGGDFNASVVEDITSTWMEAFVVMGLSHAERLGYDVNSLRSWYVGDFYINLFTNPNFNPYKGCAYRFPTTYTAGSGGGYVQSWADADGLWQTEPDTLPSGTVGSASSIALAATALASDIFGGLDAYSWVDSNISLSGHLANPKFLFSPQSTPTSTGGISTGVNMQ